MAAELVLPLGPGCDLVARIEALGDVPPPWEWQSGRHPRLRRLLTVAGSGLVLVEVRPAAQAVVVRVTGRNANEAETLVPVAARVRAALPLDFPGPRPHSVPRLRGITVFEEVVLATLARTDGELPARIAALCRLAGRRMRGVRRLRDLPTPRALARLDPSRIRAATGIDAATTRVLQLVARAATSGDSPLADVAGAAVDAVGPTLLRALRRDLPADVVSRLRRWSVGRATAYAASVRPRAPRAS